MQYIVSLHLGGGGGGVHPDFVVKLVFKNFGLLSEIRLLSKVNFTKIANWDMDIFSSFLAVLWPHFPHFNTLIDIEL